MIDAKKTKAKLRGETDRTRMSLYISQTVFQDFKDACEEIAPSRVVEELMKEFIQSSRAEQKKTKARTQKN